MPTSGAIHRAAEFVTAAVVDFLWGRVFDGIRPRAWSVGLERRQRFGILLDVVGDPGREGFRAANTDLGSVSAPLEHRVEKVWQQGAL
jgi:hypothetical protein